MLEITIIDQIQEAFDQFNRGQKYLYNTLTTTIKDNQTNETYFIQLFDQLHDHVDLFEHMNEQFLDFLQFQIDWSKQCKAVLHTFTTFQITLISNNTKHAQRYLNFLFTLFAMPESSIHDFAHETLQQLVLIVPLALTLLCSVAEQHFPFMTKDKTIHMIYIKNLLRSLSYLPIPRVDFLQIILSKLIHMDVHASRHDILRAEQINIENELVFSLEQLNTNDHENEMKHDQADKLDCLMVIIFEYIFNTSMDNGVLNYMKAKLLFKDFLDVFNKILLPTHDSSHVQFIIFYICSLHRDFSNEFMDNCWKTFVSPTVSMTFRQASICYLCGLIARAKYITTKSVLTLTKSMVDWLHAYINTTETNNRNSNPNRHLAFYAICQAVLYIFIYRHEEIVRLADGIENVLQWRLSRIISSDFNPLKFCLPPISLRFAQLARNYQIAFCYSIIETNNRYSLPELFVTNDYPNGRSPLLPSRILYSYFPFDPYLLKRSLRFIQPIYNDDCNIITDLDHGDRHDTDNGDDILTSMMMSTSPSSFDSTDQMPSLPTSIRNTRHRSSILPFGRSPAFRTIP